MKKFLIATLIYMIVAFTCIVFDAVFVNIVWELGAMPNLIYYTFGWLAAGIYIAISGLRKRQKVNEKEQEREK